MCPLSSPHESLPCPWNPEQSFEGQFLGSQQQCCQSRAEIFSWSYLSYFSWNWRFSSEVTGNLEGPREPPSCRKHHQSETSVDLKSTLNPTGKYSFFRLGIFLKLDRLTQSHSLPLVEKQCPTPRLRPHFCLIKGVFRVDCPPVALRLCLGLPAHARHRCSCWPTAPASQHVWDPSTHWRWDFAPQHDNLTSPSYPLVPTLTGTSRPAGPVSARASLSPVTGTLALWKRRLQIQDPQRQPHSLEQVTFSGTIVETRVWFRWSFNWQSNSSPLTRNIKVSHVHSPKVQNIHELEEERALSLHVLQPSLFSQGWALVMVSVLVLFRVTLITLDNMCIPLLPDTLTWNILSIALYL